MNRKSASGNRRHGRPLKKSAPGRAYDRLSRRERSKSAAARVPYLVAAWPDSHCPIQLSVEDALGDRRADLVEFLFPALSFCYPQPAGDSVSGGFNPAHRRAAADRLGPAAFPPQQTGAAVRDRSWWLGSSGISPAVRAGAESGRIHLGLLE